LVDAVALKTIVYITFVLLVVISITVAARAQRAKPFPSSLPERKSYEFSMVLILMLMLSPMSSRAHFGTLVLPGFCLARFAFTTRDRAISAILLLVVLLVAPPYKYLVPENISSALLWGGAATDAAMLLWVGCVVVLSRYGTEKIRSNEVANSVRKQAIAG